MLGDLSEFPSWPMLKNTYIHLKYKILLSIHLVDKYLGHDDWYGYEHVYTGISQRPYF